MLTINRGQRVFRLSSLSFQRNKKFFSSGSSITLKDGGHRLVLFHNISLDACWLWSNDSKWLHPSSGQRMKTPADYPNVPIQSVRLMQKMEKYIVPPKGSCHAKGGIFSSQVGDEADDKILEIIWENCVEPSYFSLNWLMEWAVPKSPTHVTKRNAITRDSCLSEHQYDQLKHDEKSRLNLYEAIFQDGVALIKNCPNVFQKENMSPVAEIGGLLAGSLSHGALYGNTFHVQSIPNAHNVAYTSIRLPPHQDLIYYESPPGIQLLHCFQRQNVIGGESIFIDALAAAHAFQEFAPDFFDILTSTTATFCKQREGADMVAFRPHVQLSASNSEIIGVHWSPPFEGPIRAIDNLKEYYWAYTAFSLLIDKDFSKMQHEFSPQLIELLKSYANYYTLTMSLKEGDMIVFNNRRVLHGRNSFEFSGGSGSRHLIGAYINMEETLCKYRLLMRKHDWKHLTLNVGNNMEA
jgi:alpha-ketoglutarate-dependent taurine dioxygenase